MTTLIDELLVEQQSLTAVDRFARVHEQHELPAQERYYRALIPFAKPRVGEQYAFGVDLDSCTGCKACVSACHSLNGLDDDEVWRTVGVIHGATKAAPYQQTITSACHHCLEPACLEGCPVRAYEKEADTGIVRHLDDQCIGCQYCVLKCPYDVPKYSAKRGIVRKCDMCSSRLAVDEAPACVQACPNGAITIRVVARSEIGAHARAGDRLLPGVFDSHYAQPTTRYSTSREIPVNARPGDADVRRLEPAHWPLIIMLVLTQLSAGLFFVGSAQSSSDLAPLSIAALVGLVIGLAVSVLHLGRPLGAWRVFLGLRTSWMIREILAFGLFTVAAGLCAMASSSQTFAEFVRPFAVTASVLGAAAIFCSAMIYVDTRRPFWSRELVFSKFFGTSLLLGSAAAAVVAFLQGDIASAKWCSIVSLVSRAALFGWELQGSLRAFRSSEHPIHRSVVILWSRLRSITIVRILLFAAASGCGLAAIASAGPLATALASLAFVLTLLVQTLERYCFFVAVIAPRMPGALP